MNVEYIIVLITCPNKEVSEEVANALLDQKLAACVNMMTPVTSLYTWEGEINRDEEMLLIVKSRADLFEKDLIPAVKAIHPYDVPEIIALPIIMGSEDYLGWIKDVTRQD
ncbi:MAG: divalent-cation tolerance protein CutA [Chloroflexota bacterium]|nr:MAG: divalent-cation tolerance protein CutA [Chloroflexota bacterium]